MIGHAPAGDAGGGQDVRHVHVHVFPRHDGDGLHSGDASVRWTTSAERVPDVARLTSALGTDVSTIRR